MEYINKTELAQVFAIRAEMLNGMIGDLGGACSGTAKLIRNAPSINIVRCEECVYYQPPHKWDIDKELGSCTNNMNMPVHKDDYCSNGNERSDIK